MIILNNLKTVIHVQDNNQYVHLFVLIIIYKQIYLVLLQEEL